MEIVVNYYEKSTSLSNPALKQFSDLAFLTSGSLFQEGITLLTKNSSLATSFATGSITNSPMCLRFPEGPVAFLFSILFENSTMSNLLGIL